MESHPSAPATSESYEFTESQNEVILATGSRAKLWGTLVLVLGVLMIPGMIWALSRASGLGLLAAAAYAYLLVNCSIIGICFLQAGRSLTVVAETEGSDITHLMSSMSSLGRAFSVLILITGLVVVFATLGIVASLFMPIVLTSAGG